MEDVAAQPDSVLAKQIDFAWKVLSDITKAEEIGKHLQVESAGERVTTHFLQCLKSGYRG